LRVRPGTDRQTFVGGKHDDLTMDSTLDPQCGIGAKPGGVRRFQMISVIAIVAAAVPYLWVLWDLWNGAINPLRTNGSSKVTESAYDFQARAILGGHLSLPNGSIGAEAFIHHGRTYTYFGVFPALLRLPVFLFTHALDGRLTAPSILASWLVTAAFSTLLLWRVRTVVRGEAPLGWAEATSYGVLLFSILAGSVLLFLASEPFFYAEDVAWSVALICGSLFALLGVVEQPSWGRVAACGLLVLLTNLNRSTTGYAGILGTLLIAAWFALGRGGTDQRRWAVPTLLAALVPLAAGCAIDFARFSILLGVPASEQVFYKYYGFSHINGGQYFGLRYLPSTFQAYATPDNLRVTSNFPYLTLPSPAGPIAHTTLFLRGPTASVLPSMPLLFATALWGVMSTFARRRRAEIRALRLLLIATAVSAGTVMIFGWVLERYVADIMPLLVLASMIGLVDIWCRLDGRRRTVRIIAPATIGLLAFFGFVANVGMASTPTVDWSRTQLVHYVEAERTAGDITGHPLSRDVDEGTHFPTTGVSMGQLFVMGKCDELYISVQDVPPSHVDSLRSALARYVEIHRDWLEVERAPHTPICRSLVPETTRGHGASPHE
jgi:hypothetical protein